MSDPEQARAQFLARTSTLTKAGHLVVVRLPQDATVVCQWAPAPVGEGPDNSTPAGGVDIGGGAEATDVTDWFADLVVIGWADANEAAATGTPAPQQSQDVAALRIEPAGAASLMTCTYVHLPTGQTAEVDPLAALRFAARGVAVQVTAAVAHEVSHADMPDDPGELATP